MANYQRILAAVDLTEESDQVLHRAADVAQRNGAELSLLHVIEIVSFAYGGDIPMDLSTIQEQMDQHAQKRLAEKAATLGYPIKQTQVATGNTETEIQACAKTMNADLIVIGSHGRAGLALLLGSTANGVLHGAECDILAVRINDTER